MDTPLWLRLQLGIEQWLLSPRQQDEMQCLREALLTLERRLVTQCEGKTRMTLLSEDFSEKEVRKILAEAAEDRDMAILGRLPAEVLAGLVKTLGTPWLDYARLGTPRPVMREDGLGSLWLFEPKRTLVTEGGLQVPWVTGVVTVKAWEMSRVPKVGEAPDAAWVRIEPTGEVICVGLYEVLVKDPSKAQGGELACTAEALAMIRRRAQQQRARLFKRSTSVRERNTRAALEEGDLLRKHALQTLYTAEQCRAL